MADQQALLDYILRQRQAPKIGQPSAIPGGLLEYIRQQTQQGPTREALYEYILNQVRRGSPVEAAPPSPAPVLPQQQPSGALPATPYTAGFRGPAGSWEQTKKGAMDLGRTLYNAIPTAREPALEGKKAVRDPVTGGLMWVDAPVEAGAIETPQPRPAGSPAAASLEKLLTGERMPDSTPHANALEALRERELAAKEPAAPAVSPIDEEAARAEAAQKAEQERRRAILEDYKKRKAAAERDYGLSRAADFLSKGFVQAAGYSGEGVIPGEPPQSWVDIQQEAKPEELAMSEQIMGFPLSQGLPSSALRGAMAPAVGKMQAEASREIRQAEQADRAIYRQWQQQMSEDKMRALSPKIMGEIRQSAQSEIALNKLAELYDTLSPKDEGYWGPIHSFAARIQRLATKYGAGNVSWAMVDAQSQQIFADHVKSISGAQVSAAEFDRLTRAMAQPTYSPEVFRALLTKMIQDNRTKFHLALDFEGDNLKKVDQFREYVPYPDDYMERSAGQTSAAPAAPASAGGMIRVRVGGETNTIDASKWEAFKRQYPNAEIVSE